MTKNNATKAFRKQQEKLTGYPELLWVTQTQGIIEAVFGKQSQQNYIFNTIIKINPIGEKRTALYVQELRDIIQTYIEDINHGMMLSEEQSKLSKALERIMWACGGVAATIITDNVKSIAKFLSTLFQLGTH